MLYLLRHAQTTGNLNDLIYGAMDCALTQHGVESSKFLGSSVRSANMLSSNSFGRLGCPNSFDKIYVSESSRTMDTLKHAQFKGVELEKTAALNEVHKGDWEGVPSQGNIDAIKTFLTNPDWRFPGQDAESVNDMWDRMGNFMQKAAKEAVVRNVLVVSSGGPLRSFLASVCFGDFLKTSKVPMPNCGYYRLEAHPGGVLDALAHFDVNSCSWKPGQYSKSIEGVDASHAWHVA